MKHPHTYTIHIDAQPRFLRVKAFAVGKYATRNQEAKPFIAKVNSSILEEALRSEIDVKIAAALATATHMQRTNTLPRELYTQSRKRDKVSCEIKPGRAASVFMK